MAAGLGRDVGHHAMAPALDRIASSSSSSLSWYAHCATLLTTRPVVRVSTVFATGLACDRCACSFVVCFQVDKYTSRIGTIDPDCGDDLLLVLEAMEDTDHATLLADPSILKSVLLEVLPWCKEHSRDKLRGEVLSRGGGTECQWHL